MTYRMDSIYTSKWICYFMWLLMLWWYRYTISKVMLPWPWFDNLQAHWTKAATENLFFFLVWYFTFSHTWLDATFSPLTRGTKYKTQSFYDIHITWNNNLPDLLPLLCRIWLPKIVMLIKFYSFFSQDITRYE